MTFAQKLFGFHGRLRRRDYWLLSILVFVVAQVLEYGVSRVSGVALTDPRMLALSLVTLWPNLAIIAKRLHDRDRSGWLAVIAWLPTVSGALAGQFLDPRLQIAEQVFAWAAIVWALVDLGILDGTKGPNRYGASPKGRGVPTDAELDEVFA
jgi:uncharacterized membrane protein YhaH (DUF805 family)